jgi:DNA modification methylase
MTWSHTGLIEDLSWHRNDFRSRRHKEIHPCTGEGERNARSQQRNIRDVWNVPTNGTACPHFATFPRKLIEPCILAGCPPGGIVLDPFVGSGTTVEVAQYLGRLAIGLDLSYQDIQANRIGGSLFAKVVNQAF